MHSKFLILFATFSINACAVNLSFTPEQSLTLDYMQTGHAVSDAHIAINNNNFTLIGYDQRGLIVPGTHITKIGDCKIKRIDGMGDVVRSPKHLKQRQKVHQYSKAYNLEILKSASCQR